MAHLHLAQPHTTAAIFSPSVARAAASTAKDWAYVDSWLRTRYAQLHPSNGRSKKPPIFERNQDTLNALLALVAANEAADEEREQLGRIEEAALNEVRDAEAERAGRRQQAGEGRADVNVIDGDLLAEELLHAIDDGLNKEGRTALDAMADVAIELGMASPQPVVEALGHRFVELQGRAFEMEQTVHRVGMLQRYLDTEAARMEVFLDELRGDEYQPEEDLAQQNLELQRKVKAVSARLPELKQQVIALEKTVGIPSLTVEEVREDEEAYLDLLAKKKDLDAQVKAFAGLPPDIEAARVELEALRTELRDATNERDTNFEKLVERESPAKFRRRP
ncbi:Uu.00g137900.m01.CDS01 [Anthostomella pinea]|uniref:Uu.00g137900.m01.CDS01 n=1 Tax=Anthostomella pinea TaxID=933095 RepID=A0AAI8YL61_9PEZI|nr:Uu.00g137900.m01.CDS01 [Anthostomella pinea]